MPCSNEASVMYTFRAPVSIDDFVFCFVCRSIWRLKSVLFLQVYFADSDGRSVLHWLACNSCSLFYFDFELLNVVIGRRHSPQQQCVNRGSL